MSQTEERPPEEGEAAGDTSMGAEPVPEAEVHPTRRRKPRAPRKLSAKVAVKVPKGVIRIRDAPAKVKKALGKARKAVSKALKALGKAERALNKAQRVLERSGEASAKAPLAAPVKLHGVKTPGRVDED